MATHNDIGAKGEQLAVDFLKQKKYEILERNWRYGKAEIDVLASFEDVLVVVEVKTRTSTTYGAPESFVNPRKIKLLVQAVNAYCEQKNVDLEVRFDIVAVVLLQNKIQIEHLEDAFYFF